MAHDLRNVSRCLECGRRYPLRHLCGYCRADARLLGKELPRRGATHRDNVPSGYGEQHEARVAAEAERVKRDMIRMGIWREDTTCCA